MTLFTSIEVFIAPAPSWQDWAPSMIHLLRFKPNLFQSKLNLQNKIEKAAAVDTNFNWLFETGKRDKKAKKGQRGQNCIGKTDSLISYKEMNSWWNISFIKVQHKTIYFATLFHLTLNWPTAFTKRNSSTLSLEAPKATSSVSVCWCRFCLVICS